MLFVLSRDLRTTSLGDQLTSTTTNVADVTSYYSASASSWTRTTVAVDTKISNSKSDLKGHQGSPAMVSFDRPHTTSY